MDMASVTFTDESSIIYRLSAMYFQYQSRLREARSRDRHRHRRFERDERRADQETARSLEQMMQRQREIEEQKALIPKGVINNKEFDNNENGSSSNMLSTE